MCGIAGVYNRNGAPVSNDTLFRMTRTLTHRGPDEEGYFLNLGCGATEAAGGQGRRGQGNVGLGHRRLSIIDLRGGKQPLGNESGSVWITFNGEIYNYRSLRSDLEARGHKFRTNSDTETIVHAYEEWGERSIERLRGMFAFAIWDEDRQQLLLARTRQNR